MNEKNKYFSEEYESGSVTDTKEKEKKLSIHTSEEDKEKEPYKPGKPHRTTIRAKITHD